MLKKEKEVQKFKTMLYELVMVVVSGFLASLIPDAELTRISIVILALLHIIVFYTTNYYHHFPFRGRIEELRLTLVYDIAMMLAISFVDFMTKNNFSISRRGMVYFIGINTVLMMATNIIIRKWRYHFTPELISSKKIYLLTTSNRFENIIRRVKRSGGWGGKIVATTLLDLDHVPQDISQNFNKMCFVKPSDLLDFVTYSVVDGVFIHLPNDGTFDFQQLIGDFEQMGIDVSLNIDAFEFPSEGDKIVQSLAGHTVVTFSTRFYDYGPIVAKRTMDIIGALIGLVVCGIVACAIGPIIKLTDGGAVFFAQNRVGKNGRVFKFYKFRSMYPDAEDKLKDLMAQNQMSGHMFKMDNDPRITPIGRLIRRTSLDELPQFYNVLKGDMSLVGTRPPTETEYRQYTPMQKRRLSFRPGITGLWQVSGRSEVTDFDEIVRLDVSYIDNWSLWQDIKILLKTIKVVFKGQGAK